MNRAKAYILLIFLVFPGMAVADLVLAVHPYLASETLIQRFEPLANYLSLQLDRKVEVRVGKDYQAHIRAIGRDTVDIAYLGPASYVNMTREYGKKPILARMEANGKPTFNGYIIVRQDGSLFNIKELENKFFAFGDKNSTMSSLVPMAMLEQQE